MKKLVLVLSVLAAILGATAIVVHFAGGKDVSVALEQRVENSDAVQAKASMAATVRGKVDKPVRREALPDEQLSQEQLDVIVQKTAELSSEYLSTDIEELKRSGVPCGLNNESSIARSVPKKGKNGTLNFYCTRPKNIDTRSGQWIISWIECFDTSGQREGYLAYDEKGFLQEFQGPYPDAGGRVRVLFSSPGKAEMVMRWAANTPQDELITTCDPEGKAIETRAYQLPDDFMSVKPSKNNPNRDKH